MSQPPLIKLGQGRDESDLSAWAVHVTTSSPRERAEMQRAPNPNAAVPGDHFWNGYLTGVITAGSLGLTALVNIYAGVAVFAVGLGLVTGITIMKRIHQQKGLK